jgi:beta-carotene 3-hydroxylase
MTGALTTVLVALVAMEPLTYAAHRWLMHGPGMGWHRSHHLGDLDGSGRARPPGFERNDLFPVCFAALTVAALAVGLNAGRWGVLVPVAVGVSLYGALYLAVHDLYIHRRVRRLRVRVRPLEHLAEAHALHHRFGGEPYGMLLPIVPASVRARAAALAQRASGSDSDHVPVER